jgi:UDP:flavonoid glycosyltransferase YjiC (YdhE family)
MRQIDEGREFFRESADACRILGRKGLFLTRFRKQVPDALPENIRHYDYLSFDALLPRVGAIVHHGGIGTLAAAIEAGMPQLVVPRAHDQPDNAARLSRLGVGTTLAPTTYRGKPVAARLRDLLTSESTRTACAGARWKIRAERSLEIACGLVEDLRRSSS